ncbi:MAG: response regulator, partial [Pseudomonadota bacterium]
MSDAPHILVVDDDARLRDLLDRFLASVGFRVTSAADAAEADRRRSALQFDAIVLDVMMPGESGVDATRRLRAAGDGTPILLLTAMGETVDRIAGLEAGADDYLPKPFEPRELELRVRGLLRRATPSPPERSGVLKLGRLRFDVAAAVLSEDGAALRLTESEARILKLLAEADGAPVAREALSLGDEDIA